MKKEIRIGQANDFAKALKETHYLQKLIREVGGRLEFDRDSRAWVGSWNHGAEETTKHGLANEFEQISGQIRRVRRYAEVEVCENL